MEKAYYLNKFEQYARSLDHDRFHAAGLQLKVGEWVDSVVLKMQNPAWLNTTETKPFATSVFFAIWVSEEGIEQNKLFYNIHALKLRSLTAYKIQSRDFAEAFRSKFKSLKKNWPNVRTNYGPLNLMEGWVSLDDIDNQLPTLAYLFLDIAPIIDELLLARKK